MFFVIKYLSHLKKGLGVLHLNTQYDYRIYHYIKDKRNQTKYPIILTTHHGLFTSMQENETTFIDYDICFFDVENRYKSYNFFLSSPIDLYYTLNILESFLYQGQVEQQTSKTPTAPELQEFVNTFQTWIGILFMESKKLFIKTEATYIQHDPIREHNSFHQTNLLWKQLKEKQETLKTTLSEEQYTTIEKHMSHIHKVGDGVMRIFKKMYGNGEFYFTYSEAQNYTDRKEFLDIFKNKVMFFSNSNKQATPLQHSLTITETIQTSLQIPKIDAIINHIQSKQENTETYSCFIFSPRKEESKKIFEDLCKNHIDKKTELLAENITGGVGKNLFKAKQAKNKILI